MEAAESTETRWFKVLALIVAAFFAAGSLANIIYFNRIRNAGGSPSVTRGEASAMVIINGILFAISLLLLFFSIYRLVAGEQYRTRVKEYIQESGEGFIVAPTTGFPVPYPLGYGSNVKVTESVTSVAPTPVLTSMPPPPPPVAASVAKTSVSTTTSKTTNLPTEVTKTTTTSMSKKPAVPVAVSRVGRSPVGNVPTRRRLAEASQSQQRRASYNPRPKLEEISTEEFLVSEDEL